MSMRTKKEIYTPSTVVLAIKNASLGGELAEMSITLQDLREIDAMDALRVRIAELEAELKETCKIRDEWCAEYVRMREASGG